MKMRVETHMKAGLVCVGKLFGGWFNVSFGAKAPNQRKRGYLVWLDREEVGYTIKSTY